MPLEGGLCHLFDMTLSIDLLEMDDSVFQMGLSERERYFMNFNTANYFIENKEYYVDKKVENEPIVILFIGIHN
jgi:hypothetical protein